MHGPFVRLIWTVPSLSEDPAYTGRCPDNVVMCKIVVPTEALQVIHEAIGKAIAARAAVPS